MAFVFLSISIRTKHKLLHRIFDYGTILNKLPCVPCFSYHYESEYLCPIRLINEILYEKILVYSMF